MLIIRFQLQRSLAIVRNSTEMGKRLCQGWGNAEMNEYTHVGSDTVLERTKDDVS